MKMNHFQRNLTDVSATMEALLNGTVFITTDHDTCGTPGLSNFVPFGIEKANY